MNGRKRKNSSEEMVDSDTQTRNLSLIPYAIKRVGQNPTERNLG